MDAAAQQIAEVQWAQIAKGDVRALAKTLRAVDDRAAWTKPLLSAIHGRGRAHIIGITGSPGAGKSTVVDALIKHYRNLGLRVGVIAVDPSSPFSGGAILGDRIRMRGHVLDEGVFIRSLATRGALGGLSRSAADSVAILSASGFDIVLLETVGVGQDEVDVCRVAQTVVVVLTPGSGDDVQAIKAGILEIADIYLINKADRDGAHRVATDIRTMLTLLPRDERLHLPPILESVATEGKGIETLAEALAAHKKFLQDSEAGRAHERLRKRQAFEQLFADEVVQTARARSGAALALAAEKSGNGADPYALVDELVRQVLV